MNSHPAVCPWSHGIGMGMSLTCVVLISLSSTGQELRHGGAHCFRCTSQVLSTFFQLQEYSSREGNLEEKTYPMKSKHKNNADQTQGLSSFPTNAPVAQRSGVMAGGGRGPCSPAPSSNYEGLGMLLNLSKPQLLKMVIPSSEGLQRINVHTQQMVAISTMPLELI